MFVKMVRRCELFFFFFFLERACFFAVCFSLYYSSGFTGISQPKSGSPSHGRASEHGVVTFRCINQNCYAGVKMKNGVEYENVSFNMKTCCVGFFVCAKDYRYF